MCFVGFYGMGAIKCQMRAIKVSWFWLFYNLSRRDFFWRNLNCWNSRSFKKFCLHNQKCKKLAKWLHIATLFTLLKFIHQHFLMWSKMCAKSTTEPSFYFISLPLWGGESSFSAEKLCRFIISTMMEMLVFYFPLQSDIDYFFPLSLHEYFMRHRE